MSPYIQLDQELEEELSDEGQEKSDTVDQIQSPLPLAATRAVVIAVGIDHAVMSILTYLNEYIKLIYE